MERGFKSKDKSDQPNENRKVWGENSNNTIRAWGENSNQRNEGGNRRQHNNQYYK